MLGLQANRFPGKPGGGPLSAPDSGLVGGWPRLLVPGMPALPPGDERYLVRGGGSVTFALEPDDEVTVTDKEGRQACEIVTFDAAGQPAAGLLGTASDGPALGLWALLAGAGDDALQLGSALRRRGIDPAGALAPHGVAARMGWEAINFFFNTGVDASNAIFMDEPWSRPGDYVLLRAMTDLVCASSACPCDIDPANAWNPTDIHVRVYPERNVFSKAIAYRMTTDADPRLSRETGFHPRTSKLTRNFTEYNGFWLPTSYTGKGAIEEYWACRERAVVLDLSPLRKFEVLGPDAEALLQHCLTRNVRRLTAGQVVYSAMCYEHGGMIDDGTLLRLGNDSFRWIGGSDSSRIRLREQAQNLGYRVWVKSSTDQ